MESRDTGGIPGSCSEKPAHGVCILHPTSCILHPASCILHRASCILHLAYPCACFLGQEPGIPLVSRPSLPGIGTRYGRQVSGTWHLGLDTRYRSRIDAEGRIPSTEDRTSSLSSRPYCPIAFLPYCLPALLPYCLIALLPSCLTAQLPYPPPSIHTYTAPSRSSTGNVGTEAPGTVGDRPVRMSKSQPCRGHTTR
jgi:hypothetical protein